MTYFLLGVLPVSLATILLLWHGDPKRRRVAGLRAAGHAKPRRRLLLVAGLSPGVALALSGDSAAFLVWFGSCAVAGWLITQSGASGAAR